MFLSLKYTKLGLVTDNDNNNDFVSTGPCPWPPARQSSLCEPLKRVPTKTISRNTKTITVILSNKILEYILIFAKRFRHITFVMSNISVSLKLSVSSTEWVIARRYRPSLNLRDDESKSSHLNSKGFVWVSWQISLFNLLYTFHGSCRRPLVAGSYLRPREGERGRVKVSELG